MKILLGITGGIAAYKMLTVIRLLTKAGHDVRCVLTPHAAEFITPLSVKSLSHSEVYIKDFEMENPIAHIDLADWADVLAIAPATANTIAKIAHGLADNLLTSIILAATCRKVIFPAMNVHMLHNLQTQENIRHLEELGFEVIEPEKGDLACGYTGDGRLPAEELVAAVIDRDPDRPMSGIRFVVTAGATREPLDPVRFISNHSSGRMGIALARELYRRGADVTLIHGAMEVSPPPHLDTVKVSNTEEMLVAIRHHMPDSQGLIMAAAPADFKSSSYQEQKIKKQSHLDLKLIPTTDILSLVTEEFPDRLYIGFALESENGLGNAKKKQMSKNLDYIVLNQVTDDFNPMGSENNQVIIIDKNGNTNESDLLSKDQIAGFILDHVWQRDISE